MNRRDVPLRWFPVPSAVGLLLRMPDKIDGLSTQRDRLKAELP
jgi:hypothetical protein